MERTNTDASLTLPQEQANNGISVRKISASASMNSKSASFFIGDAEGKDRKLPVKIIGPDEQEITPDEIVVPPDGGYGYVIVFAAFMSNVIVDGIVFSFGSLKDSIFKAGLDHGIHLDQSTLAWVGSLLTGFYLMTGPFVSAVANRFGFRTVAILGSLIAAFAFIMSWYLNQNGPKIGLLIIFYGIIGGIGFSCIYVPAVIAVGFYFEKKRALATGIAICGSGIGNFIFPPFITFLTSKFKWNGAILVLGLIVLLCGFLGVLYKPLKPQKTRKRSLMTPGDSPAGTPLLMRIKKARDVMNKWDSVNSFTSNRESYNDIQNANGGGDARARSEALYNSARKTSIASLKGTSNPITIPGGEGMQTKRLSVPSMQTGSMGESPNFSQAAGVLLNIPRAPQKAKSFVGLPDLHEIEEEHASEEAGSRENSVVADGQLKKDQQNQFSSNSYENVIKTDNTNDNSSLLNGRNGSIVASRIGNSMLIVDEMTNSRIIRVASRVTLNKPLYRDDIFYSGSLLRIPDYANNAMTSTEWTAAVTSPPENEDGVDGPEKSKMCSGSCEVLTKMLDISLLTSPTFIVFSVSGMFTMLGMFVPFVFLMDQAYFAINKAQNRIDEDDKIDASTLTLLISVIGAANTVGRILSGWIADRPCINALWLNNGAVTVMAVSTLLVPVLTQYFHFITYSCIFGMSMACFVSLRSILVVELLGLAKLTNAFGLLLLFQGVASMVATPLAGIIAQSGGGNFAMAFYAAGSFMLLSAVMCCPLNLLNNWEQSRKRTTL